MESVIDKNKNFISGIVEQLLQDVFIGALNTCRIKCFTGLNARGWCAGRLGFLRCGLDGARSRSVFQ